MEKIKQTHTYFWICLLFMLSFSSCMPKEEREAISLLKKSIAAHGGQETWEGLKGIQFSKSTQLYLEDGTLEQDLIQRIDFRFNPVYSGTMQWVKDSVEHKLSFDGEKISYQMAGNPIQNPDFLQAKKKELDAALYVVGMPWMLLKDEEVKLSYQGIQESQLGNVEVIEVDYGPDADRWWYYFNPKTHLMVGNEVQLKDHRSLVENLDYSQVEDFLFYGGRKSYRLDSTGAKTYLRASYQYDNFKLIR